MKRRKFLKVIGFGALVAMIPISTKLKAKAPMDSALIYAPYIPLTSSIDFHTSESVGNHFGMDVEDYVIEELRKDIVKSMAVPKSLI